MRKEMQVGIEKLVANFGQLSEVGMSDHSLSVSLSATEPAGVSK